MQGRIVIDYTNMVIDYQKATQPKIIACNRLHYYGNRLPEVILARKQKLIDFLGEKKAEKEVEEKGQGIHLMRKSKDS